MWHLKSEEFINKSYTNFAPKKSTPLPLLTNHTQILHQKRAHLYLYIWIFAQKETHLYLYIWIFAQKENSPLLLHMPLHSATTSPSQVYFKRLVSDISMLHYLLYIINDK